MKKNLLLVFLMLIGMGVSFAQKKTITGKVIDTFNKETLQYATITVLGASDSILLGFARSDKEGNFSVTVNEERKYLMLITCPGFADFTDMLLPGAEATVAMGEVPLYTREKLLSEFVIHQKRGAIVIKGDTTEYNADSFKVDANANVETLLKKLPGLQVDKNGQVTGQGEKVQKILVDGEEFFSDDPAVVNKNLQAKAVEKVQVFDKKSEQTEFTGVDDGERTKTINLQLKDKYKKGYFGKVALGGGNDGFFENQGMFNLFRGKQKFSVFGIAANTGKIGLSYDDNSKFGSGGNAVVDEETGFSYMINDNEDDGNWQGAYNGQGLPKAWTGGAHFSDKWNGDKHHLSANYRFSRRNIETVNNMFTQYSLPDSVYYNDQKSNTFSTSDRHGLTGLYEWKIDSLSTLKVTAAASRTTKFNTSEVNTDSKGASGALLNNSFRRTSNDGSNQNVNASAIWKKRFRKKGRSVLMEVSLNQKENENDGYLLATNTFFSEGVKDSVTSIDQKKRTEALSANLNSNVTYTEPISKKGFLELKYSNFTTLDNTSKQLSFNRNAAGEYSSLDTLFSTDYDFNVSTNRGGASLRWVYEKLNFSFGAAASHTTFVQTDNLRNTVQNRDFKNFFPSASVNYKFSRQSNLSISYRGNTQQPTIEQLQPLRQNTDPLNISIGNPNLKQEFDHSFTFRYNSYKVLSGTYIYAGGGTTLVSNDISRSEMITSSGIRTFQYQNVQGNYNSYLYLGGGYRLPKLNMNLGLNGNVNQSHFNTIVNGQKNRSDNNTYTLGGRLGYDKEKKVEVSFNPSVTYNYNKSSINNQNTSFWSMNQDLSVLVYLPLKFQFNTEVNWFVRQRTATFDRNNNVFQVNAYVSKKLMKKDDIELRLSVFDIFNQNLGFSQYGQGNAVTQQTYNTIRRYGLLSFVWNFSRSPKDKAPDAGEMIEIK